ncbi:MAG: alpha/beta hydrolase-fold protein [Verrucomicrobiales bacterium]|nr:alpha/beta hydrolase-fold protein [Verrucomicrobiales bacterium]
MNRIISFALFLLLAIPAITAEAARKEKAPPVVSPLIDADRNVTFQIKAPNAGKVSVSSKMSNKPLKLTKNEDGIWSGTLKAVPPGLYGYSLSIDGVKIIDPGNPRSKPMRSPRTSILHLPGDHDYDFKNVPHGTVHYHAYQSKPIDRFRELQVYTPPGYEEGTQEYPLLVLQHGHGDCFATWITHGKAHWTLDNLIAESRAVPMVVVMLDGHPIPESHGNGRMPENTEELRKDLIDQVLPMIESTYRIKEGRKHRAIAGLSMGGMHALTIGFSELETFASIASFSGAIPEGDTLTETLKDAENTSAKIDLLWIGCGEDDFLLEENQKLIADLEKYGINHKWHLTGGAHEWSVWRQYLSDFAPLLFR